MFDTSSSLRARFANENKQSPAEEPAEDIPPEDEEMATATLTLTNAQIKANGIPYVIIPATETLGYSGSPATIPVPIDVFIKLDNSAGSYTNVDDTPELVIVWGSDWSMDVLKAFAAQIQTAGIRVYRPSSIHRSAGVSPAIITEFDTPHDHTVLVDGEIQGSNLDGNLEDNALALVVKNGSSGDLTGGHADNSLTVTVLYHIVSL